MTIKSRFTSAGTTPPLLIDDVLDSIRVRGYDGRMSVEESLENMRTMMELNFEDITERGEFNGMKIKDSGKIIDMITDQNYLNDFLNAAVIFQTYSHAFAKSEYPRVYQVEKKISHGVETWLRNVRALEEKGLIEAGVTGKPLSINDGARETDELRGGLRDVVSMTERKPNTLVSDNHARDILAQDTAFHPRPVL